MKRDPISNRERCRIVNYVADGHEWQGKRWGHQVRIRRCEQLSLTAEPIVWLVCFNRHWRTGFASNITAAVEIVNALLRGRAPR